MFSNSRGPQKSNPLHPPTCHQHFCSNGHTVMWSDAQGGYGHGRQRGCEVPTLQGRGLAAAAVQAGGGPDALVAPPHQRRAPLQSLHFQTAGSQLQGHSSCEQHLTLEYAYNVLTEELLRLWRRLNSAGLSCILLMSQSTASQQQAHKCWEHHPCSMLQFAIL